MSIKKFKVNDKVRRSNGVGCMGIVKDVRAEVTSTTNAKQDEKALMIQVLWDNGTLSYFSPEALEAVKE